MSGRPDILVRSGQYFNFLEPEHYRVVVEDIAHGLSNICRFAGQCREFYSVAQHCVYASQLVSPRDARAALFHDCAEAFLGDVSRPLKKLLPDYRAIETRVERHLFAALRIPYPLPPGIKTADMQMLYTEQKALMPMHNDTWEGVDETPTGIIITPLSPPEAFDAFMARAWEVSSWGRSSPGDPYCMHCGKTWDMHLCDGHTSCPLEVPTAQVAPVGDRYIVDPTDQPGFEGHATGIATITDGRIVTSEFARLRELEDFHTPMPLQLKDEPRRSAGTDDYTMLPLPWDIIAPHEAQAVRNHGQSLELLASRGGLSPCEAVAILEDRPWHRMEQSAAIERLTELVRAATDRVPS